MSLSLFPDPIPGQRETVNAIDTRIVLGTWEAENDDRQWRFSLRPNSIKLKRTSALTGSTIPGLHEMVAISGTPQEKMDFHAKNLGQRLVIKTVNFDGPAWFADRTDRACRNDGIKTHAPCST